MPFSLEFTGETPREVIALMRAWLTDWKDVSDVPAVERDQPVAPAAAPKRAAKPARAEQPENQIDIEEAIAAAAVKKPAPPSEPAKPVSKDDLRRKLIELMHAKGESAPTDLLQELFAVEKIGQLDETDYARCFAAADEILTGD